MDQKIELFVWESNPDLPRSVWIGDALWQAVILTIILTKNWLLYAKHQVKYRKVKTDGGRKVKTDEVSAYDMKDSSEELVVVSIATSKVYKGEK